jgi:hypothetical protein
VLFNIILGPPASSSPSGVVSTVAAASYEKEKAAFDAASRRSASCPSLEEPLPPQSPYASGRPVDILFVPDLYDDVDGLCEVLKPSLADLPGARLLVFQYPGLPGARLEESRTPPSRPQPMRWSPDFAALVLLSFVRWLRAPEQLLWGPTTVQHPHGDLFSENSGTEGGTFHDVVIVGSGVGAHVASIFVTQFLTFVPDFSGHRHSVLGGKGSRDFPLMAATRALVLLNGYGFADRPIKNCLDRLAQVHQQLGGIPSSILSVQELEAHKDAERGRQLVKGQHSTDRNYVKTVAEALSSALVGGGEREEAVKVIAPPPLPPSDKSYSVTPQCSRPAVRP